LNAKIAEKVRHWSEASIYDKSTWVYSTCVDKFGGNVARLADALEEVLQLLQILDCS
jgi:hypothetical protein